MPEQTSTMAGLIVKLLLLVVVVAGAALTGLFVYQRYAKRVSTAKAPQPKPAEAAEPPDQISQFIGSDSGKAASVDLSQNSGTLKTNLEDVVSALAKRDIPGAWASVARARAKARSPDEQKTVDKYEKLSEDVREFWRILGDRVSKFQPLEEVPLGRTRMIFVEAQGGRYSFKYGSRILNYTIETMPSWLVAALAANKLVSDGPSKEYYGAFLAVDPEGDRSRARALWAEAANTGIKIDQVLPALDSLLPAQKQ